MKLTSKGLGKRALPFLLGEAKITSEDDVLWLRGRIIAKKVNWDYQMRVEDSDIVGFATMARDPLVVDYLAQRCGFGLFASVAAAAVRNLFAALGSKRSAVTEAGA